MSCPRKNDAEPVYVIFLCICDKTSVGTKKNDILKMFHIDISFGGGKFCAGDSQKYFNEVKVC